MERPPRALARTHVLLDAERKRRDRAAVLGLGGHTPRPGREIRLHRPATEPFRAAAHDVDRNSVGRRPRTARRAEDLPPDHHSVAKPRWGEDTGEIEQPVSVSATERP